MELSLSMWSVISLVHSSAFAYIPSLQVSYVQHVTPIPDAIESFDAASILCAVSVRSALVDLTPLFIHCLMQGVTVYRAIKNSDTHIGDWIVLPGAGGGLGHLGTSPSLWDGFQPFIDDSLIKSYP